MEEKVCVCIHTCLVTATKRVVYKVVLTLLREARLLGAAPHTRTRCGSETITVPLLGLPVS